MPKKVIALLAEGFEEVEAVTPIDYLRRAGIEVTIAAVGSKSRSKTPVIRGARGIPISADTALESLLGEKKLTPSKWDAVVVPGGLPGAVNLASSKEAGNFLKAMAKAGKGVFAICAAPARVLFPLGILEGRDFTCYPGEEEKVLAAGTTARWKEDRVVIDGNLITSRGAGAAGEFACAIIAKLAGGEEAEKIAGKVLLPKSTVA